MLNVSTTTIESALCASGLYALTQVNPIIGAIMCVSTSLIRNLNEKPFTLDRAISALALAIFSTYGICCANGIHVRGKEIATSLVFALASILSVDIFFTNKFQLRGLFSGNN